MYGIIFFLLMTCQLKAEPEEPTKESKIREYFSSDVFKAFQKHWQVHRKSFENAILLAIKDNYGYRGMNVFVRRSTDSLRLANGFYITDNVVELLLLDMTLTSLPHITMPEVTFALASNVLRLETELSKMIVDSRYILFRNQSNILYKSVQDPYKTSPFSYQQVENFGQVTIVAEECTLVGYAIAKLSGHSINLGHDTFQVKNCKFSVEISPYGNGWPPVIAPYFSQKQGKLLETLLTRPIRQELMPKLQAAVFTYINTSVIFGDYLPKFREFQDNLFKETVKNITEFVRSLNDITIDLVGEAVELESLKLTWSSRCQSEICSNHISLHNVTLHGLDTLYSSHSGGPYKLLSPSIAEAFRFNSILVRGSILFENNTLKEDHDFVADIKDVAVNFEIDLDKTDPTFNVKYWRTIDISVNELKNNLRDQRVPGAFVNGYLINVLPDTLTEHLASMYVQLKNSTMQKLSNVNVNCNNIG